MHCHYSNFFDIKRLLSQTFLPLQHEGVLYNSCVSQVLGKVIAPMRFIDNFLIYCKQSKKRYFKMISTILRVNYLGMICDCRILLIITQMPCIWEIFKFSNFVICSKFYLERKTEIKKWLSIYYLQVHTILPKCLVIGSLCDVEAHLHSQ